MQLRWKILARYAQRALVLPLLAAAFFVGAFVSLPARPRAQDAPLPTVLPAMRAIGMRVDTLFVGGYASGTFTEALHTLASDLSQDERELVGQHLDKIFSDVTHQDGLGRAGRLRVAYERALRPDGTTRSIRVLTAEAAVAGELHTAFYYEHDGKPGYYDPFGRSLEESSWRGPLPSLRVTSAFGSARMHPILHRILPHAGVDYAASSGTPVRATADGMVSTAERTGGYGNLVEIQHPNGYSTRYAHLSAFAAGVRRARWVRQGEVIGYVGMTGLATGPHLHYEVRREGRAVDPVRMMAFGLVGSDLARDSVWSSERQRLARLLARAPEMLGSGARHG
jgi:murein DD-endopeptidase MepM/ murein hydrolase activator NlpD